MERRGPRATSAFDALVARSRKGVIRTGHGRAGAAAQTPVGRAIDTASATRQVKHLNFRPAQGTGTVAKPELGTKRLCANCGAKFYDLSKDPIVCPKCHTVMELATVATRARPETARRCRCRAGG